MSVEQTGAGTPGAQQGEMNGRFGVMRLNLTPFFDGPAADGTPSGAPAAAPSGTPGTGAAPAPAGPAAGTPPATGQPSAQPATPAPKQFTYPEDRSNWVPSHRLREISTRQQQLERDLYVAQQRVAALSGVQAPAAPVDPETADIRQQFEKVYPELARLAKIADKLEKYGEIDPSELTRGQEHYYETLGQRTLDSLDEQVQTVIGGELTPFATQAMHTAFALFVRQDPQNAARYERMDPKLIKDFLQEYQNGILDPYRRTVSTRQPPANPAARLPRGGSGSAIPGRGPAPLKPADTDEYHGAAFRSIQQG